MKTLSVLALLVLFVATIACKKTDEGVSPGVNPADPVVGTSILISGKTATAMTITWGAASDDSTESANLQYKVVTSLNNDISTVADAEANGTLQMDWTANTLTKTISSLTMSTTYYITVLVKDADGNKAIDQTSTITLCSGKIMFLANVSNGNIGGSAGADGICNSNKPAGFGGSTFRAMLADGTTRAACYVTGNDSCYSSVVGRASWVFTANEVLCTADYTKHIGTTDSYALLTTVNVGSLSTTATTTFTGFNIAWGNSTSNNCTNYSTTGGANSTGGSAANGGLISGVSISCASAATIYCVEQ